MLAKQTAVDTSDLRSLVQVQDPHVEAEDAFFFPKWFYHHDLWLEDVETSENALYNYPIALRVLGPLDEKLLTFSLGEVIRKHAVLRSVFRLVDGKVVKIVLPRATPRISVLDLSHFNQSERDARLHDLMLEYAHRPFDLRRDVPLRATLLRLEEHNS